MQQTEKGQIEGIEATRPSSATTLRWNPALRLVFCFLFVYEVLYSFPFPFNLVPGLDKMFNWYTSLFAALTTWTGAHVLHLSQPLVWSPLLTSDSLFDWVENLVKLMLAVIAALLWTALDRKRAHYRELQEWLWLYIRLVLGAAMLGYGALKVIKVQFPDLFLWRLLSPYGDSSPTGLLWSFMGYSKIYNWFTGLVEMAGGTLLFIPRLSALGALISVGAMANVFMLNLGYDVPVKLYSLNLLLMGVYLLAPEAGRLRNVFVLNRTAAPVLHSPLFRKKILSTGMLFVQFGLLLLIGGSELYQGHQRYIHAGDGAPPPPYFGVYMVDQFIVDGQPRPAAFTDASRWQRITFERFNLMAIFPAQGPVVRYKTKLDPSEKHLELSSIFPGSWKAEFEIEQRSPTLLILHGEMDGKQIQASLQKEDIKSFPLYQNGFHWIQ
jgi:uncharacterized membrane protein YphA (DoxX/SURF4 family)